MDVHKAMSDYPIGARLRFKGGDCFPSRTREVYGYIVLEDCIKVIFVESGPVDAVRLEDLLEE